MNIEQKKIIENWMKIYEIDKTPKIVFVKGLKHGGERVDGVTDDKGVIRIDKEVQDKQDINLFNEIIGHEFFHFKNAEYEDELFEVFSCSGVEEIFWSEHEKFIENFIKGIIERRK